MFRLGDRNYFIIRPVATVVFSRLFVAPFEADVLRIPSNEKTAPRRAGAMLQITCAEPFWRVP